MVEKPVAPEMIAVCARLSPSESAMTNSRSVKSEIAKLMPSVSATFQSLAVVVALAAG
jgi:hypothetical protein